MIKYWINDCLYPFDGGGRDCVQKLTNSAVRQIEGDVNNEDIEQFFHPWIGAM